jgi:hypothetical protein
VERSEGDMSLKHPVTPPGIDPGTIRIVAQRLNHYATPGPTATATTTTTTNNNNNFELTQGHSQPSIYCVS